MVQEVLKRDLADKQVLEEEEREKKEIMVPSLISLHRSANANVDKLTLVERQHALKQLHCSAV